MKLAGIEITHPGRVIYPDRNITKQQLAAYYARVAPIMLPHMAGRPLSFVRCPEGIGAECFFQKHLGPQIGSAMRSVSIRHKNGERAKYAMVDTAAELVSLVQHGVIEFHVWGCMADRVEKPDRIVFDLDPGPGVPWVNVIEAAFLIRDRLRAQSHASWVKTTGGKGLHVVVPIAARSSWEKVHDFARGFAEDLAAKYPNDFLSKAAKAARPKKIFVDWLRNARGATWIAPWSARARAGAPVSAPIAWNRLRMLTAGAQYSVESIQAARLPADAWKGLASAASDL